MKRTSSGHYLDIRGWPRVQSQEGAWDRPQSGTRSPKTHFTNCKSLPRTGCEARRVFVCFPPTMPVKQGGTVEQSQNPLLSLYFVLQQHHILFTNRMFY